MLSFALTIRTLVLLILGVFRTFCAEPRPLIRYLADSSYWMYLIHLPLVVWLQVAISEAPRHRTLKLAFVSAPTVGVSLLSYDLFVRSTWLGRLHNGRRRERRLFAARSSRAEK